MLSSRSPVFVQKLDMLRICKIKEAQQKSEVILSEVPHFLAHQSFDGVSIYS